MTNVNVNIGGLMWSNRKQVRVPKGSELGSPLNPEVTAHRVLMASVCVLE